MNAHKRFTSGSITPARRPTNPIIAFCGYRCDLCPAFRANVHGPEDRERASDGWFKYFGFRIPPEQICCDGCCDKRPKARRIDKSCPIRPCAIARGMSTCAECPDCGCKQFESRTVTRAWVEQRTGAPVPPRDYRRFVLPYERRDFLKQARRTTQRTKASRAAGVSSRPTDRSCHPRE